MARLGKNEVIVVRLVTGILTAVLIPLGAVFVLVGLFVDDGRAFVICGAVALGMGTAFAISFVSLTRHFRARDERRKQEGVRDTALVEEAELQTYIRNGVLLTYDVTLRFAAAGKISARVSVVPGTELVEGAEVPILYDPTEPANFEILPPGS